MKEKAIELIHQSGFSHIADELIALLRPAVHIATQRVDEETLPLGASKIGGHPDLPPEMEVPTRNGKPLALIAQINLSEVVPYDLENRLPTSGLLYFFYDVEEMPWGLSLADKDGFQVLYFPGDSDNLQRINRSQIQTFFPACAVQVSTEWTLPGYESFYVESFLSEEEIDRYIDLMMSLFNEEMQAAHRLLGYPAAVQHPDMELECDEIFLKLYGGDFSRYRHPRKPNWRQEIADRWVLLLQVDSDEQAEMMWGDLGLIYYWIPKDALQSLDFDKTWLILQCF